MAGAKISAAFGVFVFAEIRVVAMPVGYLLNFVALLTEDHKLFLTPFRSAFRFIETSKGFAVVLDSA